MDHIAIMKRSRGLIDKILLGEKKVESRWFKTKRIPYNHVKKGNTIYFKDAGGLVRAKAEVSKVKQFEHIDEKKLKDIIATYPFGILGVKEMKKEFCTHIHGKQFAVMIHLKNAKAIEPFAIDKKGYGAMASRICCDDITKIKKSG